MGNAVDFQDKVVMDVGAGSGILSLFAAQVNHHLLDFRLCFLHCKVKHAKTSSKGHVLAGRSEKSVCSGGIQHGSVCKYTQRSESG